MVTVTGGGRDLAVSVGFSLFNLEFQNWSMVRVLTVQHGIIAAGPTMNLERAHALLTHVAERVRWTGCIGCGACLAYSDAASAGFPEPHEGGTKTV